MKPKFNLAQIITQQQYNLTESTTNTWNLRTLQAIRKCRTIELGGHIDKCDCCNKIHLSYNSCRNRHCPTCQGHKSKEWIQKREQELLCVPYFHVVFTLPSELNRLCLYHSTAVYGILFKVAWETLQDFSSNSKHLGAKIGMISVLHTWGQNLSLHPHLHCIVPAGGVTKSGNWKQSKAKGKFLFSVKAMSRVFRAKFISEIRKKELPLEQITIDKLFKKEWVIYAKKPFGRPENVIEYLGRYTHKIAISNHRIRNISKVKEEVTFEVKNYRKSGCKQLLTLKQTEFLRRFSLHILPRGFTRIRHYGILSGTWKSKHLKALQTKLSNRPLTVKLVIIKTNLKQCPTCKKGQLVTLATFDNRGPPKRYATLVKTTKMRS
jgi:hypothetical protein